MMTPRPPQPLPCRLICASSLVARAGAPHAARGDFFFIGFNLILWTQQMVLRRYGVLGISRGDGRGAAR